MTESIEQAQKRYAAAAHAMQSGVAADPTAPELSPKHLRVGVNSAMIEHGALAGLLIAAGVIEEAAYFTALADAMEAERDKYAAELSKKLGRPVTLG